MQLSKIEQQFKDVGVNIIAVTYDSVEDLNRFAKKYAIKYPLFKDDSAKLVIQLGIINQAYEPSDDAYGIPYPGMFLIDKNGVIVEKFAEEGYAKRPDFKDVLNKAQSLPD